MRGSWKPRWNALARILSPHRYHLASIPTKSSSSLSPSSGTITTGSLTLTNTRVLCNATSCVASYSPPPSRPSSPDQVEERRSSSSSSSLSSSSGSSVGPVTPRDMFFDFDFGSDSPLACKAAASEASLRERERTEDSSRGESLCASAMRFCVALSRGSNHPVARAVVEAAASVTGGAASGEGDALLGLVGSAFEVEVAMFEQVGCLGVTGQC